MVAKLAESFGEATRPKVFATFATMSVSVDLSAAGRCRVADWQFKLHVAHPVADTSDGLDKVGPLAQFQSQAADMNIDRPAGRIRRVFAALVTKLPACEYCPGTTGQQPQDIEFSHGQPQFAAVDRRTESPAVKLKAVSRELVPGRYRTAGRVPECCDRVSKTSHIDWPRSCIELVAVLRSTAGRDHHDDGFVRRIDALRNLLKRSQATARREKRTDQHDIWKMHGCSLDSQSGFFRDKHIATVLSQARLQPAIDRPPR